jgi:hypothetical protein
MAVLLPIAGAVGDLLLYFGAQAVLEELVKEGIIPAELAPYLGITLPDITNQAVDDDVNKIYRLLTSPDGGLDSIMKNINGNRVDITTLNNALADIRTAVANIPSAPGVADIAAQVWGYPNVGDDVPAYTHLLWIERFTGTVGKAAAFVFQGDPFLLVETQWKYPPD